MSVKKYYKETQQEYHFVDGGHYHTSDAIWIIEPISDRTRRRKCTKIYLDPLYNKIALLYGQRELPSGRAEDIDEFSDEYWNRLVNERHLIEITEKEAFVELL